MASRRFRWDGLLGPMLLTSLLVLTALPVVSAPAAAQQADRDGDGNNGGADVDANCLDPEEALYLELLNDLRAETGAPPVRVSGTLNTAAEAHSQNMAARNFFDHINPDGDGIRDRILAAGYVEGNASRLAENIDRTREMGREAFESWAGSPDHHRTMVDPELVAIGIARAEVPGLARGWYWTTTHANQCDIVPDC